MNPNQPWTITLLGTLQARQGDTVVTRFRTKQTGALLAFLAFYRHRPHPREELIQVLWPDALDSGPNNLSLALSSLRHQLEPPGVGRGAVLQADRLSVQLNPDAVGTDVAAFETALVGAKTASGPEQTPLLSKAVAWYGGRLLPGYDELWIVSEQQRLAERFFGAVRQLVSQHEQAGEVEGAIGLARRAVGIDPLHEPAHFELIRLLGATGQGAAASRQYRDLVRLLKKVDEAPSAATRALVQQIERDAGTSQPSAVVLETQHVYPVETSDTPPPDTLGSPKAQPDRAPQLPLSFTRFFGREAEIAQLGETLLPHQETRLLTLTGAGGTGKTRLALEVARRLSEPYAGAVWFVALADLSDSQRIIDAILAALDVPRAPNVEPMEQVAAALSQQPSLVVLDNFEHLVDEGAPVVQTLLARVSTLTCLVTSRQVLALEGERTFVLHPLPTPNPDEAPEQLRQNAGVALFVDRAQAVRPDFQITLYNAPAIAKLCAGLEGIPLALELAAARSQVLTPAQMLEQLDERFGFLVSRKRGGGTSRHRTLRSALDWSYQLLSPELQRFFARLSVFRGGWTVEAAEAVCEEPLALDYLAQLTECSLIVPQEHADGMRFVMLETLRHYGQERLVELAELSNSRRRHSQWCINIAEQTETQVNGPKQVWWLARLELEHDNLRAALAWAAEQNQEACLRLTGSLGHFWKVKGHWAEGRMWLERAVACAGRVGGVSPRLLAKVLHSTGNLASCRGDNVSARSLLEQALALRRELGDCKSIAISLHSLGNVAYLQSEFARARAFYEESIHLHKALGDDQGVSASLGNLGRVASDQGDFLSARAFYEEALVIQRQFGDVTAIAQSLCNLGTLTCRQGDCAAARAFYEEALRLHRELDNKWEVANLLDNLGVVAYRQSNYTDACALAEEALIIQRQLGDESGTAGSLGILGNVACDQGDSLRAREAHEEAIAIWRRLDYKPGVVASLDNLGNAASSRSDYASARSLYQEALSLKRELGDKEGVARTLGNLADVACFQKDYILARVAIKESLAIRRELDDKLGVGISLHSLGNITFAQGNYETAYRIQIESLTLIKHLGYQRGIACTLEGLAWPARASGRFERATHLAGAAATLREHIGAPVALNEKEEYEHRLADLREALGEEQFAAAWAAGRAMTWEQAVAFALEEDAAAETA